MVETRRSEIIAGYLIVEIKQDDKVVRVMINGTPTNLTFEKACEKLQRKK